MELWDDRDEHDEDEADINLGTVAAVVVFLLLVGLFRWRMR